MNKTHIMLFLVVFVTGCYPGLKREYTLNGNKSIDLGDHIAVLYLTRSYGPSRYYYSGESGAKSLIVSLYNRSNNAISISNATGTYVLEEGKPKTMRLTNSRWGGYGADPAIPDE